MTVDHEKSENNVNLEQRTSFQFPVQSTYQENSGVMQFQQANTVAPRPSKTRYLPAPTVNISPGSELAAAIACARRKAFFS